MKNVIYGIIIALLFWLLPIIPYERDGANGTTILENKSIVEWAIERYDTVQDVQQPGKE